MNTNLVTIVKQIITGYGEAVLADPQRLKAFLGDLAKDEPKPLRTAFGRCIEEGAYNALKTAADTSERAKRKAAVAERVRDEHGLDITLCGEALDILEAALFGIQSSKPYTSPQPTVTPAANAIPETKKKFPIAALITVVVLVSAVGVLIWHVTNSSHSENAASSSTDTVNAFFNQGVSHYNEKEYDQAIAAFNKALELYPNHAPALAYRGGSYRYKKNYDAAIADCTAALEIDRNNALAWFHRGSAYYLKGDNNRGIEDLTETIRLNSTNADAYNNRGGAYRNKGDYNRAIADYAEALKLAPDDAVIKNNLADAQNRLARSNVSPTTSKPVQLPPPVRQRQQAPNMVRINGGTFMMGSPASEPERVSNEVQHSVTVSSFYMGNYEVTQREWREVMGNNPSYFKGDNLPVEEISWYEAVEYCNKRSQREGLTPAYTINGENVTWNRNANGYRLPTEAEWEYACRAGTTTPFNTGNIITTGQANYDGNYPYNGNTKGEYRGKTWAVGSGAANTWGLYDMHGNVWEWCWDWYGEYGGGAQTDPVGPASGSNRVVRGGSWGNNGQYLRSAQRDNVTPSLRASYVGFRLARP
jgi:formylglycine-generating enzyme required for sulfatase activity